MSLIRPKASGLLVSLHVLVCSVDADHTMPQVIDISRLCELVGQESPGVGQTDCRALPLCDPTSGAHSQTSLVVHSALGNWY